MTPLADARELISAARAAYSIDTYAAAALTEVLDRLGQPLRVALAGSLKAGKSTLLNSLVGQDIAPTDATECTKVVTWYRNGASPNVTAWYDGDKSTHVPVQRRDGRLAFDLGDLTASDVDRLEVEWPARALTHSTIIDTPGTSSLSRDVSARTLSMLAPENSSSGADAVVYLMRTLNATDVSFLSQIGAHVGGESGPLGVIGVLSRADEVGAGRMDAMMSAHEVAARFAAELESTGLCQAVVPVAGLLALAAGTLRQSEFAAFETLAGVPEKDLALAMLSADRFSRPGLLPVDADLRASIVDRFGMFGIRMAITLIKLGVRDSPTLAAELTERSGLSELRSVIDVQFGQRADQLKLHSALVALQRILESRPIAQSAVFRAEAGRMLADVHGFQELRLLGRLRSTVPKLPDGDLAELQRIIGGYGIDTAVRLGLDPDSGPAERRDRALDAISKWRRLSEHPLLDQFTSRACAIAARSAEGVVAVTH
ncbi:Isoniazid-inducible protein iniC [Rhodococcus sp. PAMC28707]|uniref:dynamin family protein n=1 Tax=unclassified Rhodococcus (in: high G+C Gram-positive bacteria) TaxID=192944 RepID=UPI00109DADB2|nr:MULTISPECIES: dynamin family protein [unclassified Rhodococcus (in: high G+C Gram-positive bacteria)]QCB49984.1 Isoniazid-inducible protein iniC [Rhodococcus sp. PAMC28705]QCB58321.1 Isoniazid-inducible protein iniC [Rhodococcus sp. PAMC28707]